MIKGTSYGEPSIGNSFLVNLTSLRRSETNSNKERFKATVLKNPQKEI